MIDADHSYCGFRSVVSVPDGWGCEKLGGKDPEIERVGELGEQMGGAANDLVCLGSIVDVLVILQDGIEESIGRHNDALGWDLPPQLEYDGWPKGCAEERLQMDAAVAAEW